MLLPLIELGVPMHQKAFPNKKDNPGQNIAYKGNYHNIGFAVLGVLRWL